MANVHLHIPSFNAGELSPLLGSRFGVEKVASGCRLLRNFILQTHGPAFRRPGMEDMGASAGDGARSRLQGFNFSTTTGFILEFHPNGLQVWSNGVQVPLRNPVGLPYNEQECAELQIAQVNDVCYLTHPNHTPKKLVRFADDDWRLQEIEWKWPPLGDENVRAEEITSPHITLRVSVPTYEWAEFNVPAGDFTFAVTSPNLTPTTKTVRLFRWNDTDKDWQHVKTIQWSTVAPSTFNGNFPGASTRICRITYSGPSGITGTASVSNGGGTLGSLVMFGFQPQSQTPATIPAGEWQTVVVCTENIPEKVQLWIQKKEGTQWKDVRKVELAAGKTMIMRQPTLAADTQFRFDWRGRAMMGGTMRMESLSYPASSALTLAVSHTTGTGRTMTASESLFQAGHVGSYWQITHRRENAYSELIAGVTTIVAATSTPTRVTGRWDVFTYGIWNATLYLEKNVGGTWETVRSWKSNKDRNVIASGEVDPDSELRLRITDGTSEAASGASVPRFVLEGFDARVNGLVKITGVGSLNPDGKATTATVDVVSGLFSTAATALWTEGAWSGVKGYPRTVALHGQRLWFGGTRTEALRLWGSVVNDYENFRRTSLDDAGVSFVPAAQQSNQLQWLMSHGTDLVFGTNGDEWTIAGGVDDGPITPTSVKVQRRSGYGSNYLPALLLGEVIVFVQRGGQKLRQVAPRADGVVWSAADLTVLAEHVARGGVRQFAQMNFPSSILWAVTNDGKLLGMTFEQEQNVFGWHVHETDGSVESVAVVYGAESDEVWLQVLRNGKRRIERLDTAVLARRFEESKRLMYLDSAKRFEFAEPSDSLSGLEHLEGRQISVLGDGAELSPVSVLNGSVKIQKPCTTVVVGLPYTSTLQPMRMDVPMRDGTAQHRKWRVSSVGLYLHDSLGGEVADAPGARFEKLQYRQVSTPMGSAPDLFTGEKEIPIESQAREGVDVVIRQSAPFPLNVGSITLKGDIYGE